MDKNKNSLSSSKKNRNYALSLVSRRSRGLAQIQSSQQGTFRNAHIRGQKENMITEDFIYNLAINQKALTFRTGEEFRCSNTNDFLLARIFEKAAGVSFGEWMEKNIFDPPHMDNTTFEKNNGRIIPNLASSCARVDDEYRRSLGNLISKGSSSLYSAIEDMSKWLLNF